MSDSIVGQFGLARMRAVSTKRAHMVEVTPSSVTVFQCNTQGMVPPSVPYTGATGSCIAIVNRLELPKNVVVWNATAAPVGSGSSPAQNTGLDFLTFVYADGTSPTGATLYVTDNQQKSEFRVLQYQITGASNERQFW